MLSKYGILFSYRNMKRDPQLLFLVGINILVLVAGTAIFGQADPRAAARSIRDAAIGALA